jgi:hypothetical protein
VKHLRRVKRERTQLRQALGFANSKMNTLVKMTIDAQNELKALKKASTPALTITTLPDAEDVTYAEDLGYVTEDLNRDCCIDDSNAS